MFCTHCGSQVPTGANFCTSCGNKVIAVATPPQAATTSPAQADAPMTSTAREVSPPPTAVPSAQQQAQSLVGSLAPASALAGAPQKCPWCGALIEGGAGASCPKCGAGLQVRSTASLSGWLELPPRKDMAKLQFGNSSCQIEGLYVPVADMNLATQDSVYFTHHVLLWMDPQVNLSTMSMRGGWKRMFAGMPLIMTQARGPGHIAFSKDEPGELIALPLQPGQAVDVREHIFLAATSNVEYDWFQTQIWYRVQEDKDAETFYPVGMFMDRFSSPTAPGLLLLHAGGSLLVRQLAPGEAILVKPTALVFKDPSVQMQLHLEHPSAGLFDLSSWIGRSSWTNRSIWLRLIGPGRVAIQSVFDRLEKEGGNIVGHSYATIQHW
jgi:uncharacterized protein (AIM24 family)